MFKPCESSILRTGTLLSLLSTSTAMLLTGCGAGTPFVAAPFNEAISGVAHGGRQPIAGSTVTIWSPGVAGYGSAPTQLATKTADASGYFSFAAGDYTTACTANMPVYITVQGGNPGNSTGHSNPASLLVAPLGICGSLSSFTVVNELTTVATAFALSGFVNSANFGTASADGIGTTYAATPTFAGNNNNVTGMVNAFNTIFNLVDPTQGATPGLAANATVDSAKLITMANILAACVNSDPTNGDTVCSSMFTAASPTNSTATPTATNTFEAAFYLATNPTSMAGATSNMATVYGTASPTPPYAGGLSTQPGDWTVGVNYAVSGMSAAQRLAIDATGNVWVASSGRVTELSPNGTVITTYTGTQGTSTVTSPWGVAVDLNGNVLVSDAGINQILQFNASGYVASIAGSVTASEEPYAIAIDKNNNAWITETTTPTVTATQTMQLGKCLWTTGTSSFCTATTINATGSAGPFGLVLDKNSTIYTLNQFQALTTTSSGNIRNWNDNTGAGSNNYYATAPTKVWFPTGAVFDASGNMWISNPAYNNASSTTYGTSPTASFITKAPITYNTYPTVDVPGTTVNTYTGGGLNIAKYIAIDGNSNLWIANSGGNGSSPTTYSVSEFSNAGAAISPATTGFVHTMNSPFDIAVDASGNVWVTSSNTAYVTEIVGAAAPAVTPIAFNTKYNTWGVKP
ncbi:MAG: hypothetical protein P4L10_03295 [Acidobacteriaceae bacterium]|nr:hypothetical protein [Acidobacteriaceae bacterium]